MFGVLEDDFQRKNALLEYVCTRLQSEDKLLVEKIVKAMFRENSSLEYDAFTMYDALTHMIHDSQTNKFLQYALNNYGHATQEAMKEHLLENKEYAIGAILIIYINCIDYLKKAEMSHKAGKLHICDTEWQGLNTYIAKDVFLKWMQEQRELKLASTSCTAGEGPASPPKIETEQGVSAWSGDRDVPHEQVSDIKALSCWQKIRTYFSDKCEGWTLKVPYLLDLHFTNRK